MFDRHQAEITVMQFTLSSSASVYDCTMGFYLVPYCQPTPPTRFLPITAIGMCHLLPVHHFGMACLAGSKVNIQHLFIYIYSSRASIKSSKKGLFYVFSFFGGRVSSERTVIKADNTKEYGGLVVVDQKKKKIHKGVKIKKLITQMDR